MCSKNGRDIKVVIEIDREQLNTTQSALAFLADECATRARTDGAGTREERHFSDALYVVLYIASAIGESVLDLAKSDCAVELKEKGWIAKDSQDA